MKQSLLLVIILFTVQVSAQYQISGQVDNQRIESNIYLSLIEDYRKLSGVYSEQIIARTISDSTGEFKFTGDQIDDQHRLYRIHVDNCENSSPDRNHFSGRCPDSKEIIFIAKDTDSIKFPITFDNEIFCDIQSSNEKTITLMKIDSLKEEMQFALANINSEANTKLNTRKWFKILQDYGTNLNEPLANLYVYSFLSDRRSDFYNYYLSDLASNDYYDNLENQLAAHYTGSSYTIQYQKELASDRFIISKFSPKSIWHYLIYALLSLSIVINIILFFKWRTSMNRAQSNLRSQLTQQENKILDLLLTEFSNKEIAERLFVSLSTVKTHVNNIYKKYNVQSRDALKNLFIK